MHIHLCPSSELRLNAGLFFFLMVLLVVPHNVAVSQNVFIVDTWFDDSDAVPGDGFCATNSFDCTLRAAIEEANALPNVGSPDVISFANIPLLGDFAVIALLETLEITTPLIIDGSTAPGEVILDGTDMIEPGPGIEILGNGSTIKAITMGHFYSNGAIHIEGDNNVIERNYIGVTRNGDDIPNQTGIFITGENNRVGGVGSVTSFYDLGLGNVIGNSVRFGMGVAGSDNIVRRNFIGLDRAGQNKGNSEYGIFCLQSTGNTIGGQSAAHGNRIGYNGAAGIILQACEGTVIRNNYIGTDNVGSDFGNEGAGIALIFNANGNTVGGSQDRGNVIGFNETGIIIDESGENNLRGNFIGINRDGDPIGNVGAGISNYSSIASGAYLIDGNVIGYGANDVISPGAEKGNVIGFNGGAGINMFFAEPVENAMRGNSIFQNGALGIDLENDGTTGNDADDVDTGANLLQNHPDITRAFYRAGNNVLAIEFTVSSADTEAAYPLVIDAYIADEGASGEGEVYIGTVSYETPGGIGFLEIPADDVDWALDDVIVLTATDADGNTSEFSPASTELSNPDGGPSIAANDSALRKPSSVASIVTLSSPYPNPFNPQATFTVSVSKAQSIHITIHDMLGRLVTELHHGVLPAQVATPFTVDGSRLASGTYLLRVTGNDFVETRRLLLMK